MGITPGVCRGMQAAYEEDRDFRIDISINARKAVLCATRCLAYDVVFSHCRPMRRRRAQRKAAIVGHDSVAGGGS